MVDLDALRRLREAVANDPLEHLEAYRSALYNAMPTLITELEAAREVIRQLKGGRLRDTLDAYDAATATKGGG